MKQNTNPVRGYLLMCVLVLIIYSICVFYFLLNFDTLFAIVISVFLYSAVRFSIVQFGKIFFESILYREMDPARLNDIVFSSRWLKPPIGYKILIYLYSGNYKATEAICIQKLESKLPHKTKCYLLTILARVYFELNDFKKLDTICKEFEDNTIDLAEAYTKYPVFLYYKSFLNDNYQLCLKICEDERNANNRKSSYYHLRELNWLYLSAIAYYKIGNMQKAKTHFQTIMQTAPKMHIARIAQTYLDTIHTNEKILPIIPSVNNITDSEN